MAEAGDRHSATQCGHMASFRTPLQRLELAELRHTGVSEAEFEDLVQSTWYRARGASYLQGAGIANSSLEC